MKDDILNEQKISESRRSFLKKAFTMSVFTISFPHILLAKIEPWDIKKKGDKLLGNYFLNLNDLPMLKELWGSVRVKVEGVIGFFPKIIITKVPKDEYDVDYICVSEMCPHEGYPVSDLNLENKMYECTGHGTLFLVDGTYFWGPASRDLERFEVTYNGGDYISIDIYAINGNVDVNDKKETLFYLNQNYPNPCSDSTVITYGLEKPSNILLELYDLKGTKVLTLENKHSNAGDFSYYLDTSFLAPGTYIINLSVNNKKKIFRMMTITR